MARASTEWYVNVLKQMIEDAPKDRENSLVKTTYDCLFLAQQEQGGIIGAYLSAANANRFAAIQQRLNDLTEDVLEMVKEENGEVADLYHPSKRHLRPSAEARLGVWTK